jgi:hypothetical protein
MWLRARSGYDREMRILVLSLLLGVAVVGCGSDDTSSSTVDMTMSMSSMDMTVHDLSTVSCNDMGTLQFGDTCATDCDCQSSMCRQFSMGATHRCTKPCTTATAATDCPMPPSTGMCTPNNYCKF